MKAPLVYILTLTLLTAIVPCIAFAEKPNIEAPKTLVHYETHGENIRQTVQSEDIITINTNTFTEFKVLDCQTNTVFDISARDYVIGVICAEMPASFEQEALKAQAVASYTYAVRQTLDEIENPTQELLGANFSDDPQKYQAFYTDEEVRQAFGENYDEYYPKISEAVDSVFGQVIIYNEEPIVAAFHAMSSGKTESSQNIWGQQLDYLVAVESAGDEQCEGFSQQYTFATEQMRDMITQNVENADLSGEPSQWLQIISVSESGTVLQLFVGNVPITGTQLRSMLDLRSAAFDVAYNQEDGFVITTYGYGHGVGMSQFGANEMAKNGYTYNQILSHYYPRTKIAEIEIEY